MPEPKAVALVPEMVPTLVSRDRKPWPWRHARSNQADRAPRENIWNWCRSDWCRWHCTCCAKADTAPAQHREQREAARRRPHAAAVPAIRNPGQQCRRYCSSANAKLAPISAVPVRRAAPHPGRFAVRPMHGASCDAPTPAPRDQMVGYRPMLPPCAAPDSMMELLPNRAHEPGAITAIAIGSLRWEDVAIPTPRDRKVTSQRCQDALEVGRQGAQFSDPRTRAATLAQPTLNARRQVIADLTVPSASRRSVRCSGISELDEKRKCSKRATAASPAVRQLAAIRRPRRG